jgi:glycosyltransferase involved in cell wall biosynthesis
MKTESPLVSIGLPVYNGENFVAEAIQCVRNQTFSNWELIICDNNSTDGTVALCREFADQDSRIRVYQNSRNSVGRKANFSSGQHMTICLHRDSSKGAWQNLKKISWWF